MEEQRIYELECHYMSSPTKRMGRPALVVITDKTFVVAKGSFTRLAGRGFGLVGALAGIVGGTTASKKAFDPKHVILACPIAELARVELAKLGLSGWGINVYLKDGRAFRLVQQTMLTPGSAKAIMNQFVSALYDAKADVEIVMP